MFSRLFIRKSDPKKCSI